MIINASNQTWKLSEWHQKPYKFQLFYIKNIQIFKLLYWPRPPWWKIPNRPGPARCKFASNGLFSILSLGRWFVMTSADWGWRLLPPKFACATKRQGSFGSVNAGWHKSGANDTICQDATISRWWSLLNEFSNPRPASSLHGCRIDGTYKLRHFLRVLYTPWSHFSHYENSHQLSNSKFDKLVSSKLSLNKWDISFQHPVHCQSSSWLDTPPPPSQ